MWFRLTEVAKDNNLDYEKFKVFVTTYKNRYGVTENCGELLVNTWYYDSVVKDYRNFNTVKDHAKSS